MSLVGAVLLLFAGLVGLLASWNAARPVIDPTRWYSPSWLPGMIVGELAPLWLLIHGVVLGLGWSLGGTTNAGGRWGALMLIVSAGLLLWVVVRTALGVFRTRRTWVGGRVHPPIGPALLTGLPVRRPEGVAERPGIEWVDGLTLDLIRPDDDRRRLPVMVYAHGGGWTGGDPQRQARDMYHALALDGWAVLAIRYPFAPDVSVERQIETVKSAVRWARDGLDAHGIEAETVVLAGGSAGAHLAAMAALDADHHTERVAAGVCLYGIYDMANRHRHRAPWGLIRGRVMGERVSDAPTRYDAVSPICRVTEAAPPFLLVHGTRDTLVPIAEAEQFAEVLSEHGRPAALMRVPGAQHAFDAVSSPTSRTVAAAIRDWLGTTTLANGEPQLPVRHQRRGTRRRRG